MKRIWKVSLSLMIILLVGGGVAYTMGINKGYFRYLELKDYTKDYISPSQKNKGFVTYNSINNKFSFDFPENFFILPKMHNRSDNYEGVYAIHIDPDTKDVDASSRDIDIVHQQLEEDSVTITLDRILYDHSYNNQYEKISFEDQTIYKGEKHIKTDTDDIGVVYLDASENGANYFFALVIDNKTFEAVEIAYSFACYGEDKGKCVKDEVKERETFETIINSISFK